MACRPEVGGQHASRRAAPPPGVPLASTRPRSSTWIWLHTSITSWMSCSTSTTATPVGRHLPHHRAERGRLALVLPAGRLVEQQHLRVGRQRPGQLDHPRLAGGQPVGTLAAELGDAEPLEELVRDLVGIGRAGRRRRPAARSRGR